MAARSDTLEDIRFSLEIVAERELLHLGANQTPVDLRFLSRSPFRSDVGNIVGDILDCSEHMLLEDRGACPVVHNGGRP